VLLAQQMGLKGVALGTLIAAALVNLGILLPYVSREFDMGVGTLVISSSGRMCSRGRRDIGGVGLSQLNPTESRLRSEPRCSPLRHTSACCPGRV